MSRIHMGSPDIGAEEISMVMETLAGGWITQGKRTEEFERKLCDICNADFAIAMNNGTSTLHAALVAIGVGRHDEVIVPSLTYISSVNSILYTGATPVFVDCCDLTYNVTAETIQAAISPRTKAVMTVDMKGMPVDFDRISKLLSDMGIAHISDSAESLGATYNNKPVGTQADLHSFSFFANKNITTGEGGALVGNSAKNFESVLRILRNQGQGSQRYHHEVVGFNYRFNDVSASIGVAQLSKLQSIVLKKQNIAEIFNREFADNSQIETPHVPNYVTQHSWYNYCIKFPSQKVRDAVIAGLEENNIEWRISFKPCHLQPSMRGYNYQTPASLQNTERCYSQMLDIPCQARMTESEISKVIETVVAYLP